MKYLKLLVILFMFISVSCTNEEPENKLFSFRVEEALQEADTNIQGTNLCISTNGEQQTLKVAIAGDFDSFNLSDDIPNWLNVKTTGNVIEINLPEFKGGNEEKRSATIGFSVFKGSQSSAGRIIVSQSVLTLQDMLNREQRAIDAYLQNYSVITEVPADFNFQTGENAPFYKLGNTGVYMQVLSKGDTPFVANEKVYFRLVRANLITMTQNYGEFQSPCYFIFKGNDEISMLWGDGLKLPLEYGIGNGKVRLIVPSNKGLVNEVGDVIPYEYVVSYYKANI